MAVVEFEYTVFTVNNNNSINTNNHIFTATSEALFCSLFYAPSAGRP